MKVKMVIVVVERTFRHIRYIFRLYFSKCALCGCTYRLILYDEQRVGPLMLLSKISSMSPQSAGIRKVFYRFIIHFVFAFMKCYWSGNDANNSIFCFPGPSLSRKFFFPFYLVHDLWFVTSLVFLAIWKWQSKIVPFVNGGIVWN